LGLALLVWDATAQDYHLSPLAEQLHGLLAPLTRAPGDDDEMATLLAQVAGAQAHELDQSLTAVAKQQADVKRQLDAAVQASQGHLAAEELTRRAEDFAQARTQIPTLKQARVDASRRWQDLDVAHKAAVIAHTNAENAYRATQHQLTESERAAERYEREWSERFQALQGRAGASHVQRKRFPPRWIGHETLSGLKQRYINATQASLRSEGIERELSQGQWETDATVEEKALLMRATVGAQQTELDERKASNEAARTAVGHARERYIDVLRSTVRRYRKNIVELGQLAGVEVNADLSHLENDDTVLRQAELKVSFNFDGKGQIGLNDGEASGGVHAGPVRAHHTHHAQRGGVRARRHHPGHGQEARRRALGTTHRGAAAAHGNGLKAACPTGSTPQGPAARACAVPTSWCRGSCPSICKPTANCWFAGHELNARRRPAPHCCGR